MTDREILQTIWRGGRLRLPDENRRYDENGPQMWDVAGNWSHLSDHWQLVESMLKGGLIKRRTSRRWSSGYHEAVLTDMGRELIKCPTQKELERVELASGPDVRSKSGKRA